MKNEIPCSNMVLSLGDNKTNVDLYYQRYSQKLLTSPSDSCLCSSLGPFCDFRGGRSGTVIVVTDCRSWEIYPPAWHDPCSTEH